MTPPQRAAVVPDSFWYGFQPHENQRRAQVRTSATTIVISPARQGKTGFIIGEALRTAWHNPYSGMDGIVLMTAPTYGMVRDLLEEPMLARLREIKEQFGMNLMRAHNREEHKITLTNGRVILFRSLEKKGNVFDKLRGLNVYALFPDELALGSKQAWDTQKGRVSKRGGFTLGSTTPKGRNHWLYQDLLCKGQLSDGDEGAAPNGVQIVRFRPGDNPDFGDAEREEMMASMDPLMVRQEIFGEFVVPEDDRVFYAFSRERNIREYPQEELDKLTTLIGLDFNVGINAFVVAKRLPGGHIHVYAEHQRKTSGRTTKETGDLIVQQYGAAVRIYPDATGVTQTNRQTLRTETDVLAQCGLYQVWIKDRSNPSVEETVSLLNAHFLNGLGNTFLTIDPRCTQLIDEMESLVRDQHGKIDDQGNRFGHLTSGLRYLVWRENAGRVPWRIAA